MAAQVNDSDGGGSMTPSEQSDGEQERSEHDSDYETDDGEEEEDDSRSVVDTLCACVFYVSVTFNLPVPSKLH